jgi:hypothetical protein
LNNTGITIPTGSIVMIISAIKNAFSTAPALTSGAMDFELILGIASEDILTGESSNIVVQGIN